RDNSTPDKRRIAAIVRPCAIREHILHKSKKGEHDRDLTLCGTNVRFCRTKNPAESKRLSGVFWKDVYAAASRRTERSDMPNSRPIAGKDSPWERRRAI